jgi:hypothetical protein
VCSAITNPWRAWFYLRKGMNHCYTQTDSMYHINAPTLPEPSYHGLRIVMITDPKVTLCYTASCGTVFSSIQKLLPSPLSSPHWGLNSLVGRHSNLVFRSRDSPNPTYLAFSKYPHTLTRLSISDKSFDSARERDTLGSFAVLC